MRWLPSFGSVGIVDWRGSNGRLSLTVNSVCEGLPPKEGTANIELNFDVARNEALFYDFDSLDKKDIDKWKCKDIILEPNPKQEAVTDFLGNYLTTTPPVAKVVQGKNEIYTFVIPFTDRFNLYYPLNSILRYTGFSERRLDFELFLNPVIETYGKNSSVATNFTVVPPRGFEVVESAPSGQESGDGRGWITHIVSKDGTYHARITMRNSDLARVDHILDESIAAVLGVAVGGILNSYLALTLLRRRNGNS